MASKFSRRPPGGLQSHGTQKRTWQNAKKARRDKTSRRMSKEEKPISSEGESVDSSSGDEKPVKVRKGQTHSGIKRKHDEKLREVAEHSSNHVENPKITEKAENAEREKEGTALAQVDSEWIRLLSERKYPESYIQTVDTKGACPLYKKKVLSHLDEKARDLPDGHQLQTTPFGHEKPGKVESVLEEYAAGKLFSAWTSVWLALALNVKTSNPVKDSVQSLFLAEGKPPVVFALCEDGEEIRNSALAYAGELARALTSLLLSYCHCEFIILTCVIPKKALSVETLRNEIEEKRRQTSKIYYRRQHLSRSEYLQLKKAVTTVSRVSPVPRHLADSENNKKSSSQLVLLDEDWYNLVLYFIKKVMEGTHHFEPPCPSSDTVVLKVKAAAKEAGSRLGVQTQCTERQKGHLEIHIGGE